MVTMVTITEIAKRANVSVGTVDRVIHNRGRVSKETADRVRKIIKELNYKPNILARSLSLSKVFNFGVLMPELQPDNHYWELAIRGIDKAHEELKIHKVNIIYYQYDGYSETSFLETADKVIQEDLDGLLIVPTIFKTHDDEFVRKIPPTLPFAFFNSNIPNSRSIAYIGQDSFQSGVLAGNLMLMITPPTGSLAVLTMLVDDYHLKERLNGFRSYVESQTAKPILIYGAERSEDKDTFDQILDCIFSELDDLTGIFVTTAMTYRVAEYIKTRHIDKDVKVIGYDLTDNNIKYLQEGLIHFIIGHRTEIQGYQGIYTLYRYVVLNEPVERQVLMPLDVVTQANVSYYQTQYAGGIGQ